MAFLTCEISVSMVVSVGSLLIALIALWRTIRKDSVEAAHKKKALIRAKGYRTGDGWRVKVWNDGIATARNIRFIAERPEVESGVLLFMHDGINPYPILNGGDSYETLAALAEGHDPVPIIKFVWDDDFSDDREREQVLEFD